MTERWCTTLEASREPGRRAEIDRLAALAPDGGPWMVRYDLDPERGRRLRQRLPGRCWSLWRYRELLPIAVPEPLVDLGEGGTPLTIAGRPASGARILVKEEGTNPTGSFKDRGLSLAVHRAVELGCPGVELASAGNAGIALSAYAAAHGLPARVALPEDTPEAVRRRCRVHGAETLDSPGTLVDARRLLEEDDRGWFDVSTFREPYRVEGKKTMGLEVAEQLDWTLPDWIVYPTGGGTGIVAMAKAFDELEALGLVDGRRPRFVVVQMEGCAPIVRAWEVGAADAEPWEDPVTGVWGLRVPRSLADREILDVLRRTDGRAERVGEDETEAVRRRLGREDGRVVGPEGAAAMAVTERLLGEGRIGRDETVVVFQTGHPANYGLV